ncbi:MAG: AAA family ATPase [Hyphomicrobiales bacterium]|nr:MAG: AAA family ATPase [Hyphomicrobiales bacterium]
MSDDDIREPDQLDGVLLPESRTSVIGHAAARENIMAALDASRLPGGILLHGPRGIGKATLAFDIAREVFARTGDESREHIAAQLTAGSYPNLQVLRKSPRDTGKGYYTAIRVEEVRGLIGESRMTRGRAGFRIVIVDAIDDCNPSSANALLKILEEPPPETLFLLVSHRPGGLLPTIKSRCHSVALRPLSDDQVRQVLGEQPGIDAAVELAAGRPRRGFEALALGDDKALTALQGWLRAPATSNPAAYLAVADLMAAGKEGAGFAFGREMLLDWIAAEARAAAQSAGKPRLASATALWEKANAQFADAEEYNLDVRQTLISLFDAIRRHAQSHLLAEVR